jgi:hypothetical protein
MGTGGDGDKPGPALPLEALLALGLDQRTAENALVNNKVTANLAAVIAEVSPRRPLALAARGVSAGAGFLSLMRSFGSDFGCANLFHMMWDLAL